MPKDLTPQQKKALSYEHDRRNAYGQNAKASRSAIPKRKAAARRAYRHVANQTLKEAAYVENPEQADLVEARVAVVVEKPFHKYADIPLKEHITRALEKREFLSGEPGDKVRRRRLSEALREFKGQYRVRKRAFLADLEKRRSLFASWLQDQRQGIAANSPHGRIESVLTRKQVEFDREEAARTKSFKERENAAWVKLQERNGARIVSSLG